VRSERPRLLIVDAPGGPVPQFYGPRLPKDIDVRVVVLELGDPESAHRRADALREWCVPHIERERHRLSETVEKEGRMWAANGILAFSERVVHDAASAALALGLTTNSATAQEALRDKAIQRQLLRDAGVTVPPVHRIDNINDVEKAADVVGFPSVLKPVVGSSSLSVFLVNSRHELPGLYEEAVRVYVSDPRQCTKPSFLLERKLEGVRWHRNAPMGDHASVESLVAGKQVLHLTVTDKFPLATPFRETGDMMPSILPADMGELVRSEATRAITALGITVGAVHTEIKLTANGPRVIEVNGRIGGGVAEMLELAAGYNIVAHLARLALGIRTLVPATFARYAGFFTPQMPAIRGRVRRAPSVDYLVSLPCVTSAEVLVAQGSEPDWRSGTYEFLARVLAAASQSKDLIRLSRTLLAADLFEFEQLSE
jgi:hypothetical protein